MNVRGKPARATNRADSASYAHGMSRQVGEVSSSRSAAGGLSSAMTGPTTDRRDGGTRGATAREWRWQPLTTAGMGRASPRGKTTPRRAAAARPPAGTGATNADARPCAAGGVPANRPQWVMATAAAAGMAEVGMHGDGGRADGRAPRREAAPGTSNSNLAPPAPRGYTRSCREGYMRLQRIALA